MFNQEQLNLIYSHFGHRGALIMFDSVVDTGGFIAVVFFRQLENVECGVTEYELVENITRKRNRNKYIKLLDNNSDIALYGFGNTKKEARLNLLNKISGK